MYSDLRSNPFSAPGFLLGRYKTWTLDSGLDYGLEYGLDFGLGFGLDSIMYKLTSCFGTFQALLYRILCIFLAYMAVF